MDVLELDRRAVAATGSLVERLTDSELDNQTPCPEWTVRELIGHMVEVAAGNQGRFGLEIPVPEFPEDPRQAWFEAQAFAAKVFEQVDLTKPVDFGAFGSFPGAAVVGVHTSDTLVHAWDVARAIGQPCAFDAELGESVLKLVSSWPDVPQLRAPGGAFGPKVPVPADASVTDRLVAFCGRSPSWSAASAN